MLFIIQLIKDMYSEDIEDKYNKTGRLSRSNQNNKQEDIIKQEILPMSDTSSFDTFKQRIKQTFLKEYQRFQREYSIDTPFELTTTFIKQSTSNTPGNVLIKLLKRIYAQEIYQQNSEIKFEDTYRLFEKSRKKIQQQNCKIIQVPIEAKEVNFFHCDHPKTSQPIRKILIATISNDVKMQINVSNNISQEKSLKIAEKQKNMSQFNITISIFEIDNSLKHQIHLTYNNLGSCHQQRMQICENSNIYIFAQGNQNQQSIKIMKNYVVISAISCLNSIITRQSGESMLNWLRLLSDCVFPSYWENNTMDSLIKQCFEQIKGTDTVKYFIIFLYVAYQKDGLKRAKQLNLIEHFPFNDQQSAIITTGYPQISHCISFYHMFIYLAYSFHKKESQRKKILKKILLTSPISDIQQYIQEITKQDADLITDFQSQLLKKIIANKEASTSEYLKIAGKIIELKAKKGDISHEQAIQYLRSILNLCNSRTQPLQFPDEQESIIFQLLLKEQGDYFVFRFHLQHFKQCYRLIKQINKSNPEFSECAIRLLSLDTVFRSLIKFIKKDLIQELQVFIVAPPSKFDYMIEQQLLKDNYLDVNKQVIRHIVGIFVFREKNSYSQQMVNKMLITFVNRSKHLANEALAYLDQLLGKEMSQRKQVNCSSIHKLFKDITARLPKQMKIQYQFQHIIQLLTDKEKQSYGCTIMTFKERSVKSNNIQAGLKNLFQQIKGDINELIDKITEGSQYKEVLNKLQFTLSAKEFNKITSILKTQAFQEIKNNIQLKKASSEAKNPSNSTRNQLIQIFKQFKVNTDALIDCIVKNIPYNQVLLTYEQMMIAKQYNKLVKILQSDEIVSIMKDIKRSKLDIAENNENQIKLQQLFEQFKFPQINDLVMAIVNGQSQEQILLSIEQSINARQYKVFESIRMSKQVIDIRNHIRQKKIQAQATKYRQQLTEQLKQFNIDSSKLIEAIISKQSFRQQAVLDQLSQQMNARNFNSMVSFLNSQKMKQFRLNMHGQSKQVKTQINRKQLSEIFSIFRANTKPLVDAILQGESQSGILDALSDQLNGKEYKTLLETLKSEKVQKFKEINKSNAKKQQPLIMATAQKVKSISWESQRINEDVKYIEGNLYDVQYLGHDQALLLPDRNPVSKIKQIIKKKLNIKNQICIQIKKNNELVNLQDHVILKKYGVNSIYVSYYLHIIVSVQIIKQSDSTIKILSSQPIFTIQSRIQNIINMKRQSQRWLLNGQQLTNTKNITFQALKVFQNYVRIIVLEDKSLQFYGFDKIIPIEKSQFKNFYIEDDEQVISMIKSSCFPQLSWSNPFRNICLSYIFSGIKKHYKIQHSLVQIQNILQKAEKGDKLWKPKNFQEKALFNQTYVLYNIIKSCKNQTRKEIFRHLMGSYPIPLIIEKQNSKSLKFFEEHYWLTNKAFTIISFGLARNNEGTPQQINGKSVLLNLLFETDFQDKSKLHRECIGGISIQYNIFQNQEYYVNLIDVSNKVQQKFLMQMIGSCNMAIIHTNATSEDYIDCWIKQRNIGLPVIIFKRDMNSIFQQEGKDERKKEKNSNQNHNRNKKFSIFQISTNSFSYYNTQFNQIANSVQEFVRLCYSKEKSKLLWKFSDFLAKNCGKDYQNFNNIMKDLQSTDLSLSKITNYFYEWKELSYNHNIAIQKLNKEKMSVIEQTACRQGISPLLKKILQFYNNHSQKATSIIGKLRQYLSANRHELFRDFNELNTVVKDISQCNNQIQFEVKKEKIKMLFQSMNQIKTNFITVKLKKCKQRFFSFEKKYKKASHIDDAWRGIFKDIKTQFEDYIQPKIFSLENFWRQIIYMTMFQPSYTFQCNQQQYNLLDTIVRLGKRQIHESQHFEIINGDLLEMPINYLKKLFQNQQSKKIMIVGVLGLQSSGKSTLLNFVLGCNFASSAGRCTKGIYGTYFQIANKQIPNCEAILVLDTQGLFSNYKNERFENRTGFDNKLVLFCLQVCDLLIINTKGDMTNQCQQILANAFDSQTVDCQNLPNVYFVLNCNGGPANITQTQQIEKACEYIIKVNPQARPYVSAQNSKGMPMAFNQAPRKTNATEIRKYLVSKKTPSSVFYKQVNNLSRQIFKILSERGRARNGRTLCQAIDDMGLTWATINRFSILTMHDSQAIKKLQQQIQSWIKIQSEILHNQINESKSKMFSICFKQLKDWEKQQLQKYQQRIDQLIQKFQRSFPVKIDDKQRSANQCIKRAINDIYNNFSSIVADFKRSVYLHCHKLEIEESQQNGLDDIITLVKKIKHEQLTSGNELSLKQKKARFERLWSHRLHDMRKNLNKKNMASEHYNTMQQLYNAILKASQPNKTIYKVQSSKKIADLFEADIEGFNKQLISFINKKYSTESIFQNSNQKPIMNIQKNTGDLSFKYLDMSKYFEKKKQIVYYCIRPQDIITSLNTDAIKAAIKKKIVQKNFWKDKVDQLHDDFHLLFGVQIKKQKLSEWFNYQLIEKQQYRKFQFQSPEVLKLPQDCSNLSKCKKNNPMKDLLNKFLHLFKEKAIKDNKQEQGLKMSEVQLFQRLKILKQIPNFLDQIKDVISKQKCPGQIEGITVILNMLLKKILLIVANQRSLECEQLEKDSLKEIIEGQIKKTIISDLKKINIHIVHPQDIIHKAFSSNSMKFDNNEHNPIDLSLQKKQLKQIIQTFSSFWKIEELKNKIQKDSKYQCHSLIKIGFIYEMRINIKEQYLEEKILTRYIGKQYQQFLNEIFKSNFKKFIERQLRYQCAFTQLKYFITDRKLLETNLDHSVLMVKNKVNQILNLINKDLQQVSQKLRFDFIIELHTYAFHLLWLITFKEEWKNKESLILKFQEKKQEQYLRFLDISSGKIDQQNKATSKIFITEYLNFLNDKIGRQKKQKITALSKEFNSRYSRERIQQQIEARLQNQHDQNTIIQYFLKPQQYIDKILQEQVKSRYLMELEKYSNNDYREVVRDLTGVVSEVYSCLPDANQCSIEDIFQINIFDQRKNRALIQLFCQMIQKKSKEYVSSQKKLGNFTIKKGIKLKLNKICNYKQNLEFLQLLQKKKIVITNIKLFCDFLKKDLRKLIESNDLKRQISKHDQTEAMKSLKIEVCKQQCPICKKSCDYDMMREPHHSVHRCFYGHQIRAIGGMAIEELIDDQYHYKASILRCNDLTPDSKFQFNGKTYKWSQFKLEYSNQWNFLSFSNKTNRQLYERLWSIAAVSICRHYSRPDKQIEVVQYSKQEIRIQRAYIETIKSVHYIFAIDESSSMIGQKWNKALKSLKETIQLVSNANKDKNQYISLFKFNTDISLLYDSVSPEQFDKNIVVCSGGNTTLAPVFSSAHKLMTKNIERDNVFIFISDGEAEYPIQEIQRIIAFKQLQARKKLKVKYTSIFIGSTEAMIAPVMQRITYQLKGEHKLVIDAAQISGFLKEVHFKK